MPHKNPDEGREYQRQYSAKHKYKISEKGKAWYLANREKNLERRREWYKKNKEKALADQKANRRANPKKYKTMAVKYRIGISAQEQEVMRAAHGFACAICKDDGGTRGLFFDHCHLTGKVRGLLCHACNSGIGYMRDNHKLLRAAALYVQLGGVT